MKKIINKLLKFHRDQKGSTLMVTMIAMVFIGTLGSLILMAALANYEMNNIDYGSKKSFYLAERAMDEIHAGIGVDAMDKLSDAYTEVLGSLVLKDGGGTQKVDNKAANEKFHKIYYNALKDLYCNRPTADVMNTLKQYVKEEDGYTYTYTNPSAIMAISQKDESGNIVYDSDGDQVIDYVVIEDVKITCENANIGYYSSIKTDIIISAPEYDVNFTTDVTVNWNSVFEYIAVAHNYLNFATPKTTVVGNLFAGDGGIIFEDQVNHSKLTDIDIKAMNIVTTGSLKNQYANVSIDTSVSGFYAQVWAQNIMTDGGYSSTNTDYQYPNKLSTYDINARCLLYDDLQISGDGSNVSITGEYFGYGSTTSHAEQNSAIVVNGQGSKVNLKGIDKLLLLGNAFVNLTQSEGQQNYGTGESISLKGNQVAYLAEAEALKDVNSALSNPTPVSDYQSAWDTKLNNKEIIKIQVGTGENALYYFYKKYDDVDSQISTFNQFYNANCTSVTDNPLMKRVKKMKIQQLEIDNSADIYTRANIVETDGTQIMYTKGPYSTGGTVDANKDNYEMDLKFRYNELCSRLEDYREGQEIGTFFFKKIPTGTGTAYENVVDTDRVTALSDGEVYKGSKEISTGGNTYTACYVVCDNAGGSPLRIDASYENYGLIICSGKVVVEKDFEGLILANEIMVSPQNDATNVKMTANADLIWAIVDDEGTIPDGLAKRIAYYLQGFLNEENDVDSISSIDYDDIVGYENWAKNQ